jgi:hypothetical protein
MQRHGQLAYASAMSHYTESIMAQKQMQSFIPMLNEYPRFEIRFGNAGWVIFDTYDYRVVEVVKPNTYKRAEEIYNA